MTEMNRIECAAEQSYSSFCHEKLTTNLCAIGKDITKEITKPQSANGVNKTVGLFKCHFTFNQ
jgi:hypothetical protein